MTFWSTLFRRQSSPTLRGSSEEATGEASTCFWGLDNLPDINPDTVLSVSEDKVRQPVLSFPAGSSGGPDSMHPRHLKDMLLCRESSTDFLAALTGFTNVVLAGLCPKEVTPFLFGGRLLALNKKSGVIRPIAEA